MNINVGLLDGRIEFIVHKNIVVSKTEPLMVIDEPNRWIVSWTLFFSSLVQFFGLLLWDKKVILRVHYQHFGVDFLNAKTYSKIEKLHTFLFLALVKTLTIKPHQKIIFFLIFNLFVIVSTLQIKILTFPK